MLIDCHADAQEFFFYQYLPQSQKALSQRDGLTSIIIVCFNELDYTRRCVESLRRLTDEPYELIFVDNALTVCERWSVSLTSNTFSLSGCHRSIPARSTCF